MNILYTLNSGKPGGMEQHVLDLVIGMVKRCHSVYVWCQHGEITDWYEKAGAGVTEVDVTSDLDFDYIKSLKSFLKNKKIDVIHSHELKASANSLIAGFLAGTKVRVSHIHTPLSEWKHSSIFKKLIGIIQTFFYAIEVNLFSHKEIVLTESRKRVKKREGICNKKLEVIPNGLDLARFDASVEQSKNYGREIRIKHDIPEDRFVFGIVSRITEEKGHKYLVRAFKNFIDNYIPEDRSREDFHLLIAGGGALEDKIRVLVKKLGLERQTTVTGIFDLKDLHKLYRAMNAFVFPSLAEGFGFVLVEAMYSGLPIVCSNIEVLKEVAGDTVNYFETANVDDISLKMKVLYDDIRAGKTHAEPTIQRVINRYSMGMFVSRYQNLYASLLRK